MSPVPVPAWLDEPEVKRVEDLPDNPDPVPHVQIWLRPYTGEKLWFSLPVVEQLVSVGADADGIPCLILLVSPLLGDGLVRLVRQLLSGSDPGGYNPFRGCLLTPEGLRGLVASLDRASAMLDVPSFLREHPDAPRAA